VPATSQARAPETDGAAPRIEITSESLRAEAPISQSQAQAPGRPAAPAATQPAAATEHPPVALPQAAEPQPATAASQAAAASGSAQ
jgi:hypothetical protein